MAATPLKLYWQSHLIGVITGSTFSDFPWVGGRFEPRRVPKRLREVLDWFAAQADADEPPDPPFAPDLLEGWVIIKPDGSRHELLTPPLIDFDTGAAEWR
ncbi:MAG: hypothetical protein ABGY75_22650 [Gemmataceae bacterium]